MSTFYAMIGSCPKRFLDALEGAKEARRARLVNAVYRRQVGMELTDVELRRDAAGNVLEQKLKRHQVPGSERLLEAFGQHELGWKREVEISGGVDWCKVAAEDCDEE